MRKRLVAVLFRAHAVNGCRPVDSAMEIPTVSALFDSRPNLNIASNMWKRSVTLQQWQHDCIRSG
jgi:hypothetical protein